jgi:hypothetical protein
MKFGACCFAHKHLVDHQTSPAHCSVEGCRRLGITPVLRVLSVSPFVDRLSGAGVGPE